MKTENIRPGPRKGMSKAEIEESIDAILAAATISEKIGMMSGHGFFEAFKASGNRWGGDAYRAGGGIERLGVPALYFTDGPRGVARGNSTCFPCSMARGATFDTDLEHRIGQAMGIESRAQDATLSGAVCINLLRHPGWGRAQETYGEDQHLLGEMGAALGTGIQTHNVVATLKHYALNSMENARFKVDVRVDERTLHEVYLPHFKRGIDAGVATVMSAYNKVNGEYCGENRNLLTDILREEWGFDGFVHSDWIRGVYSVEGAAAGLDVENPEPLVFGDKLLAAVDGGQIAPEVIDLACRRILRVIYRFATADDPLTSYPVELVACEKHTNLAREAAEKGTVLLENDGLLPFNAAEIKRVAVLGRLADLENTGDLGSSRVHPPYVVTPLEGFRRRLGADAVLTADESDLDEALRAARASDAVIVVAGYTYKEEGEFIPGEDVSFAEAEGGKALGGDRSHLGLPADQVALIRAAAQSGKPVLVVLVAGAAVLVEEWRGEVQAIVQTFYAGMEGGTALARLLFGDVSPSGRLPFTVAKSPDDYPYFDREADSIAYDYWHGYAMFEERNVEPRYAFGHGLSYSRFSYANLSAKVQGDLVEATVEVRNVGDAQTDEVVMMYVGFPGGVRPRAPKSLKAFARISLAPNESRSVRLTTPVDALRYRNPATHGWDLEPGEHRIIIARSAADREPLMATVTLSG